MALLTAAPHPQLPNTPSQVVQILQVLNFIRLVIIIISIVSFSVLCSYAVYFSLCEPMCFSFSAWVLYSATQSADSLDYFFPLIVFSSVCDSKADRLQNKRHFFSTLLYVSVLHLVILHFLFLVLFIAVSNNLRCKQ